MALINERDLARINEHRRAKGLPPLTLAQARLAIDAASDQSRDDSFDWLTFLVAYEILSSGENTQNNGGDPNAPADDPPFQGAGGTSGGGGASGDYQPNDPAPTPETDGGGKGGEAQADTSTTSDTSTTDSAPSDSGGGGGGGDGG